MFLSASCAQSTPQDPEGFTTAFADLAPEEQAETLAQLRVILDAELLAPELSDLEGYAHLTGHPDVGIVRLLARGKFDGITTGRGGGAYYSFSHRVHDYDQGPDIEYQTGRLLSGFYGGNDGQFEMLDAPDLLDVSLQDIPEELREAPPGRVRGRATDAIEPGQIYALRSVRKDEDDVLVALEVLAADETSMTFAWRLFHHRKLSGYEPVAAR